MISASPSFLGSSRPRLNDHDRRPPRRIGVGPEPDAIDLLQPLKECLRERARPPLDHRVSDGHPKPEALGNCGEFGIVTLPMAFQLL